MSRSLDSDVLVRLEAEDPRAVYNDISRVLTDLPANNELLEIEVLGESYPLEPGVHFLQDGVALAIPKLRIAQAFLVGRQVLHEHLMNNGSNDNNGCSNDQVILATSVLLLMDPEHLTASNIRKRAILSSLQTRDSDPSLLLNREMQFVNSLLTAHLYRHAKSPTLWGHRRWLLAKFIACDIPIDLRKDMSQIIMVSGERHPRNCYGWHHARWPFHDLGRWGIDAPLVAAVAGDVKRWCFKHPSDISGWSFLMFLVDKIPDQELRRTTQEATITETLELADTFRWTNETVWVFLRTVVARAHSNNPGCFELFSTVNDKLSSRIEEPHSLEILQKARCWHDKYHSPRV